MGLHDAVALERAELGADGVIGELQRGGELVHGVVRAAQEVDEAVPRARVGVGFPRGSSAVSVWAAQW